MMRPVLLKRNSSGRGLDRRGPLEGAPDKYPRLWKALERILVPIEHAIKGPIWDCKMCGQCILHETGMTCPMGCPKEMRNGPCGGLGPNGECEVKPEMKCVWLKAHERAPKLPWSGHIRRLHPAIDQRLKGGSSWLNYLSGRDNHKDSGKGSNNPVFIQLQPRRGQLPPKTDGALENKLRSGKDWVLIGEMNPPDGVDLHSFKKLGQGLTEIVDVVSVTEHPSARNHMSSIPAAAALESVGVETICTLTCRDRNRIALQGDLLGASALGIKNALLVTGNHMVVGDHPNAKPVFDLDSINLLRLARRLRDDGCYESGRSLDSSPTLFLGAAAAPFAQPTGDRPARVGKKLLAGADFIVSQHVFDIETFRRFVEEVYAAGTGERSYLLGAVAVLPSAEVAHRLNSVLTGFQIPPSIVKRMEQSRDPQETGIEIAAETIIQMREIDGVSGNLIAPLSGGQHVMTATDDHEVQITREVVRRSGLDSVRNMLSSVSDEPRRGA